MLHLHRSERADALVGPLAAVLAEPPDDPFSVDVVAVPTRGVERWLAQRLSHHLGAEPVPPGADPGGVADDGSGTGEPPGGGGVCAAVSFGSPSRLVSGVLSGVLDLDPADDPWQVDRLGWRVLEVVDECAGEPWCAPVGRYLGVGSQDVLRFGRRLRLAERLARLLTSYGTQRPAMLCAWADGRDEDGTGRPVPADLAWQPELWRRLRGRLEAPSPAERLADALTRLTTNPDAVDLPGRLSLFGPTRLPEDQLRVLHALSRHREVHLWLPHPSDALWRRASAAVPAGPHRRAHASDGSTSSAAHPLLASMARDATELQLRLAALGSADDVHHPAPPPPPTVLGALQGRLRGDDPDAAPLRLADGDRSVEVHACHGRSRQVEVLRDVLVGRFAADASLEPRDVLVMCPDVEAFAPLVTAAFGLAGEAHDAVHPGQTLRVRLADRSLRQTNPLLSVLSTVLELADGRVTASQVLDLAAAEPVRRRFRFDDDDLDRIRDWAVAAGAHWGEDLARRARFGLPQLPQGTWETALDRVLLGAAMAEEHQRFVGPALPLDDVDSTDIDLAGRLAELVDRLTEVLAGLDGVAPLTTWVTTLDRALDLLTDTGPADGWQGVQARQLLADVRRSGSAGEPALRLPDVRAALARRLEGRPTRAGFRTGALTICSLEPMRAVPHRVVCLLGMDDGAFPRGAGDDGDDVLLRDPCLGERDRRSEDRQLFLDAVIAATEHLVVLYSGADERTGAARPPAVPVGELLDALDRTAETADGRPLRERLVVRHPLQTVDERNYVPGALGRPGPFSYDAGGYRAARAGRLGRSGPRPFLDRPLPVPPRPDGVDLDDLVAMLEHPVKWFLRRRLQVSLPGEADEVADRLPLAMGPLSAWQVGDRLLAACLAGADRYSAVGAEWRRGEVPPKELGRATLDDIEQQVVPIAGLAQQYAVGPARAVDTVVELASGTTLTGTVPGVHGDVVVRTTYSRLGAKHRLRAWVQLLALVASEVGSGAGDAGTTWRAATVGRGQGRRPGASAARLRTPDAAWALQRLDDLVRLRERALREPLPMPVATAYAYARSRHAGDSEVQALLEAARAWDGGFERADEHHVLCFGEDAPLSAVLGVPDRTEQAWWPQDGSRLGVLARRVWEPLLDHEEIVLA